MNISPNNLTVSFGRVMPVKLINTSEKTVQALVHTLNSNKSNLYSKQQEEDIRCFFKETLGDYDGKTGVNIKRLRGNQFAIISGKDLKDINRLTQAKLANLQIKTNSKTRKRMAVYKVCSDIGDEIRARMETGYKSPRSLFEIKCKDDYQTIKYTSYNNEKTKIIDGFVITGENCDENKAIKYGQNVSYEEKELNILL